MKKILMTIICLVIVTLGATFAFAHSGSFGNSGFQNSQAVTYNTQVEEVIENGSYEDLLSLREELGYSVARWVDSEEDFAEFKKVHEAMEEKSYMRHGFNRGYGRGGIQISGGGCGFR
ncbi:MAG: hypothetical protein VX028_01075 [Nanoarchaeota archaeon]|nr:hypothetical protein [Nanoarchaeota archaeon]MEC8339825.1 hypothetical protein [Nanoarchaeota archaeon]